MQAAVLGGDVQLVVIRVEQLDPILRAFGKRNAMPHLFARTIGARLPFSGPPGNLKLGSTRREPRIVQAIFDLVHECSPAADRKLKLERNCNGSRSPRQKRKAADARPDELTSQHAAAI